MGGTTVIYTIPSLALFSLLLPWTGITPSTVIIGLALYALTILVRNVIAGLRSVPDEVREAAIGNGYGPTRLLFQIELPLALPVIMAGVRVATVSTVALVTVGAIVSYGGWASCCSTGSRPVQGRDLGGEHARAWRWLWCSTCILVDRPAAADAVGPTRRRGADA